MFGVYNSCARDMHIVKIVNDHIFFYLVVILCYSNGLGVIEIMNRNRSFHFYFVSINSFCCYLCH